VTIPLLQPLLRDDLRAVDGVLHDALDSDVGLIRQIAAYIIASGGKRLRPALLLLTARACGYRGAQHHTLAAVIEMIHTATLLHDDVVDESALRRGHATANATFGNSASVLVGDFLYSRAFQLMVTVDNMRVLQILSEATNVIAEGEVLQLMNSGNPDVDEQGYLGVIRRKTAKLLRRRRDPAPLRRPTGTGVCAGALRPHLGTAFQLIDMYWTPAIKRHRESWRRRGQADAATIRAAGRVPEQVALIRSAVKSGRLADFQPVLAALRQIGALDYARSCASAESEHAASCLATLPPSAYRELLLELTAFAVTRAA
jgi:octaprenyl-diphosphate synthase